MSALKTPLEKIDHDNMIKEIHEMGNLLTYLNMLLADQN
jgi:hypothetical protein